MDIFYGLLNSPSIAINLTPVRRSRHIINLFFIQMQTQNLLSKWNKVDATDDDHETPNQREQLISAMVSFMRDCGFSNEHVNVLNVIIVAESAHRPIRGFWQTFEFSMVLEALDRYLPGWRDLPQEMGMAMPLDEFIIEIRRQTWLNAFDEENAERFFALAAAEHPTSAKAAFMQIRADLLHIGAFASLEKLKADGISAGARAYERYQCIDAADNGKTHLTSLGQTVKDCRDAARKEREKREMKHHRKGGRR
ncbi:hypothetical protein [Paraburkholderia sp. D1E]|uniref:hypothetical protein n=1 Tax=Paraburkholderia sp. D1E TaxID=3461398 RepID=UPI004045AB13